MGTRADLAQAYHPTAAPAPDRRRLGYPLQARGFEEEGPTPWIHRWCQTGRSWRRWSWTRRIGKRWPRSGRGGRPGVARFERWCRKTAGAGKSKDAYAAVCGLPHPEASSGGYADRGWMDSVDVSSRVANGFTAAGGDRAVAGVAVGELRHDGGGGMPHSAEVLAAGGPDWPDQHGVSGDGDAGEDPG